MILDQSVGHWVAVRDGCSEARRLKSQHYTCRRYRDGRTPKKLMGPGEYMLLMTPDDKAVFGWRRFRSADPHVEDRGVNCSLFRNDGSVRSSDLIREADELAFRRWPGEFHYTYVDPRRVRSTNPGYCFLMAGWQRTRRTRKGLVVLELAAWHG